MQPPPVAGDYGWALAPPVAMQGYRPARPRGNAAIGLFVVRGLLTLLTIVALLGRESLVQQYLGGSTISVADADASDNFVRTTAYAELGVSVLLAIAFLMWLHRIVWNNRELGAMDTRFSPAFAVGCWFIPFANFVMPFQAVREAWKAAADPTPGQSTPDTRRAVSGGWLVPTWWALFLVADVLGVAAALMAPNVNAGDPTTILSQLGQQTYVSIASSAFDVLAVVVAVLMVLRLTALQEGRAARLAAQRSPLPPGMAGWTPNAPAAGGPPPGGQPYGG